MCDFDKHGIKLVSIAEILFSCLAIVIIVFSFFMISNINKSEELKIRVNFETITNNKWLLNYLENEIENNETNIYEKFFKKYNLTEGDSLGTNENILSSFKSIYKLDIAIIVLVLILLCLTIIFIIIFFIGKDTPTPFGYVIILVCSQYLSIGKSVIIFILFGVFLGLFISYKNKFQDDFINFYSSINNNKEQIFFKEYYFVLFDLKNNLIINVIILPLCSLFDLIYFIICEYSFGKQLRS